MAIIPLTIIYLCIDMNMFMSAGVFLFRVCHQTLTIHMLHQFPQDAVEIGCYGQIWFESSIHMWEFWALLSKHPYWECLKGTRNLIWSRHPYRYSSTHSVTENTCEHKWQWTYRLVSSFNSVTYQWMRLRTNGKNANVGNDAWNDKCWFGWILSRCIFSLTHQRTGLSWSPKTNN